MDRNNIVSASFRACTVALRKESVDRNLWWGVRKAVGSLVALRKESVDRNSHSPFAMFRLIRSLSARRAWIEIACPLGPQAIYPVALRKESVDRNHAVQIKVVIVYGRSPQGERG